MKLLLQPHNDDAVLFACWTLLRERPYVVTVLRSYVQEVPYVLREAEDCCAMNVLGCELPDQWRYRDDAPDWRAILSALEDGPDYEHVYAPAVEVGGHEHHSRIGHLARDVFGRERLTSYLTYTTGAVKSTGGREVSFEPGWVALKLRALACYESQFATPSHRHFVDSLREYVL